MTAPPLVARLLARLRPGTDALPRPGAAADRPRSRAWSRARSAPPRVSGASLEGQPWRVARGDDGQLLGVAYTVHGPAARKEP